MSNAGGVALLLFATQVAASEPEWQARVLGSVVQIELLDKADRVNGCGVGTVVARGVLVSARHVLDRSLAPGGFRLTRLVGGAQAVIRLGQAGTELFFGTSQDQAHDVAFLTFPVDALDADVAPAAWLSEASLRQGVQGAIVSYHSNACVAAGEVIAGRDTWRPVTLEPPRDVVLATGDRVRAMHLTQGERAGYSGSPVVSIPHQRVVGVYVAGLDGKSEGYATSLAAIQQLWRDGTHGDIREAHVVPRHAVFEVALAPYAIGLDPRVSALIPELSARFRAYIFPSASERLWLTLGLRLSFESRTRQRVTDAYPGNAPTTDSVDQHLLGVGPLLGLRAELDHYAVTLDPGLVVRGILLSKDAQWFFSWEPTLALLVRVSPWNLDSPAERIFRVGFELGRQFYSSAMVSDYVFDLSGSPRPQRRSVHEGVTWVRLAAEVGW